MNRIAFVGCCLLLGAACGDDSATGGTGGSGATGAAGGAGGASSGGAATGGAATGGAASGGAATGGAATGGAATGGAATGGGSLVSGDCETNADCPPDGSCVEIEAAGYRVCQYPVVEATSCGSKSDACCTSADCVGPGEKCLSTPITAVCGGILQKPHNECAADQCQSDGDCGANEICAPEGTLGNQVKVCLTATCHGTLCGQKSLAPCAVIRNPCCGAPLGLFCAYGCLTDADCPGGYCDIDGATNQSICVDGSPICPL